MPAMEMNHDDIDPKQAILDRAGDLSGVEIFGSDVLVALYIPPTTTKSGIILSDATRDESRWQGKVGLILKLGPTAYVSEEGERFRDIKENDWVVFRPSDGYPLQINTMKSRISKDNIVECRVVTDIHIRARVAHPDLIY
jgi:co-chaperonin GroES (HSP10)